MNRLLACCVVLLAASFANALDPVPTVLDGAGMFSKQAIDRVSNVAAELKETFGIQLVIETTKAPPGVDSETLRRMKNPVRELRGIAQERALDLGVNGLFVLITTDPRHVSVVGWPVLREGERALSRAKREELRKSLAKNLHKDPDDALVRAIDEYRERVGDRVFEAPLGPLRALAVVGVLVGLWAFLAFVRSRAAAPERPLPIYQPAMLGSLFGVPAGFWIHDRLFQAERPVAPVARNDAPAPLISERIQTPPNDSSVRPANEEEP